MNITQQAGTWTGNWLKITMDHAQGCDWLLKGGMKKHWVFHNHHGEPSLSTTEQVRSDKCSTRRFKVCHIFLLSLICTCWQRTDDQ